MLNFCITQGAVFRVHSRTTEDCTKVKVRPVRSRFMRGIVYLLSVNKNLVKW